MTTHTCRKVSVREETHKHTHHSPQNEVQTFNWRKKRTNSLFTGGALQPHDLFFRRADKWLTVVWVFSPFALINLFTQWFPVTFAPHNFIILHMVHVKWLTRTNTGFHTHAHTHRHMLVMSLINDVITWSNGINCVFTWFKYAIKLIWWSILRLHIYVRHDIISKLIWSTTVWWKTSWSASIIIKCTAKRFPFFQLKHS